MLADEFPKLLIISSEGPNTKTAGGLLLYRLLIEREEDASRGLLNSRYVTQAAPWRRLEQSRFHRLKRSLHGLGLAPVIATRTIDRLLDGFRPDVILSVMQHAAYYCSAAHYARAKGIQFVVIVHDVNDQFERVYDFAKQATRRRDAAFYRQAHSRLCVSPEMEALCADLYGVRGDVLYPNRAEDLAPRPFFEALNLKMASRLSIGFAGNLNYGYGNELLRQMPAFRATNTRLVIFSQRPGRSSAALLDEACVDFRGFAPSEKVAWAAVKAECDAVIMPYPNPAGAMERLYRHHFPSKLPEYLALGMPVIVTGPDYATGVKWAAHHADAVVHYASPDLGGLARIFERLRDDADERFRLAQSGYTVGNREFDPALIKMQFLTSLRKAAAARPVGAR
jgi:glycosyltransferase involved in cell wall biosynthesis